MWIKQKHGEKPLVIATSYHDQPAVFHNGFDMSGRFETQIAALTFNLTISNIEPSDTATYYCATTFLYDITFGEGTFLIVKGTSLTTHEVLQQPPIEYVQSGDSVTLECTVNTEGCSEDHSLFWLRHGSRESTAGIVYKNRSDQCEKSYETGSSTQSCIYKLPKTNLGLADAGTYYCAVAACGVILFGSGTKLDITGENLQVADSFFIHVLIFSNIILFLAIVLFVGVQCKKHSEGSPNYEMSLDAHSLLAGNPIKSY
ncbi:uncharacterized protein [Salminus brasiliensis]|uniref:uncharacterized protein n=1 Tax=Salminus brasiliensis TaxID=930266 RepID=UPI003B836FB1